MLKRFNLIDVKTLVLTAVAVLVVSVGGAFLSAYLDSKSSCTRANVAEAAGSACEGDIVVYEYHEDVVQVPGNTITIEGSLLAVDNGVSNVTIQKILGGAVGDLISLIRKANATGTVTLDSQCGSATADTICLGGDADWKLDSKYDSITLVKRPGSEFWVELSRTDNAGGMSSVVDASVYKVADQSLANQTWVKMNADAESWDAPGWHDPSTNNTRITVNRTGKFLVFANVMFRSNGTGIRGVRILKNNVTPCCETDLPPLSGADEMFPLSYELSLNSGDYIEIQAWQASGGALNGRLLSFSVVYLGN